MSTATTGQHLTTNHHPITTITTQIISNRTSVNNQFKGKNYCIGEEQSGATEGNDQWSGKIKENIEKYK